MKRIIGVFAALALGLAIAACGGSDDGDGGGGGAGGTGGGGTGGGGGNTGECAALEQDPLVGSCVILGGAGCTETRGTKAAEYPAESKSTCEQTGGAWSTGTCPAAAGGACVQAMAPGGTTVYTWTEFSAAEVQSTCANFPCAIYVAP